MVQRAPIVGVTVQFRMLGPLEVLDDDSRPLVLGGAKQRALLAVLLLQAGEVVSADRLIDELWGEDPPETARSVLQVYVANLRRVLEPARPRRAATALLVTQPPGYRLDLGTHALDLVRFEQLVADARASLAAGRTAETANLLGEALALWCGPALAEVVLLGRGQGAITELEERRLAALEQRIEADLVLGRHAVLVGELEALVTAHPLREHLRGQLMLALYRCGRQAEALEVYRQTRETLAEELGIDPSHPLQDLQRAILAQDPRLGWKMPARLAVPASEATAQTQAAPGPLTKPVPAAAQPPEEPELTAVRRTVTILCVGIAAIREGDEVDPESLQRLEDIYVGELRRVVGRHGGTVQQFTADGGTAVFGIPTVHENDAVRAVRAAAELREALAAAAQQLEQTWGARLSLSAGIQTGEVLVSATPTSDEWVAGASGRLAHQLEQAAAPGEILLEATTYGLVRDAVRVETAPTVLRKPGGDQFPAWRLLAITPRAPGHARRLDSPMVGRARERALLGQALERSVAERACHLFTVLGEAGVGKSRLVAEFLGDVHPQAAVLRGRCLDYGEGITWWPVVEVVRKAVGVTETDTPAEVRAKLASTLQGEQQAVLAAQRVAGLLGLDEVSASAEEIAWAVRELLEVLARHRPLVVVLDDLQWAEPALLELIEHLADWTRDACLLLVCIARPELLEAQPHWAGGKLNATSILLEPLSEDDCAALVDGLLDEFEHDTQVRDRIVRTTSGNPLFVEELLGMLIDDGRLVRADGRWVLVSDLASLKVPQTISALLATRLGQLPEQQRAALTWASVIGEVFYRGAVAALAPRPSRGHVVDDLRVLIRKRLIRPYGSDLAGEDAFRFRHILIRDAAYAALRKQVRADLHERVADWLEQVTGARLVDYEEIIGYHLEQAYRYHAELGPVDEHAYTLARRAAERLGQAGQRALGRGDVAAAVKLLDRAVVLLPVQAASRRELLADLGAALRDGGQKARARAVLSEAIDQAQAADDARIEWRAMAERFEIADEWTTQVADQVEAQASRMIPVLQGLGDTLGLAKAWRLKSLVQWTRGQHAEAEDTSWRAAHHAHQAGNRREEVEIIAGLAGLGFFGPLPAPQGVERCQQILEQVSGNRRAVGFTLTYLAGLEAMQGRFAPARELLAESKAVLAQGGIMRWVEFHAWMTGYVETLADEPAAAERALRSVLPSLEALQQTEHLFIAARLLIALSRQGHDAEALRYLERLGEPHDDVEPLLWVEYQSVRATVLARRGENLKLAETLTRHAVELAATTDSLDVHGDALAALAEVLQLTGQRAEASQTAREALALYQRKGNAVSAARARAELAGLTR
jgi:DNA-binding SARP family transcriptional activator/class 3 adenylate cyclase/tetratricopeptide (TPR) repeat protein